MSNCCVNVRQLHCYYKYSQNLKENCLSPQILLIILIPNDCKVAACIICFTVERTKSTRKVDPHDVTTSTPSIQNNLNLQFMF